MRKEWGRAQLLDEIHSDEILLEQFMKLMGVTAHRMAAEIDELASISRGDDKAGPEVLRAEIDALARWADSLQRRQKAL
ncbi:MAG TPA: hypothetical protein DCZ13_13680 [Porticoccaceae bacterium]|nr:hypothetical protein [Porticoccaceae bacterium]